MRPPIYEILFKNLYSAVDECMHLLIIMYVLSIFAFFSFFFREVDFIMTLSYDISCDSMISSESLKLIKISLLYKLLSVPDRPH